MNADSVMRALVWEAPERMVLHEQPIPKLAADEVLIKVAYAGICGSELSGYLGENALRVPPLVMGHEFAGEIVALGKEAHEQNPALSVGQAVTANPLVYCGECEYCARGLNQLCTDRKLIGAHRPGAFAEYIAVPAQQVLSLPSGVSARKGALVEPVACAVRIGEIAGDVESKVVLVAGAGTIGLLTIQVMQINGASRVFNTEINPERLAIAQKLGAEPLNPREVDVSDTIRDAVGGVDVAVDAVGLAVTRGQCVAAARTAGKVVLSGLHEETSTIPAADIIRREIQVCGSFCYTPESFAKAANLLAQGRIGLDPWIVDANLVEGGAWFDRLIKGPGGVAKVLLTP